MPGDLIRQTYPEAEKKSAPEVWSTHAAFYGGKCSKKRETQKGMVKGVPRGRAEGRMPYGKAINELGT
jgi:hypothetical protein